jgi:hypothetical protein
MKKRLFALQMSLLLALPFTQKIFSQNIAINTTGNRPDTSAMLDITSTNQGFLMPRLTSSQITSIFLPATGLLVYNSNLNAFQVNVGTSTSPVWNVLGSTKSVWSLTGNTGAGSSNFLGTTDNADVVFKRSNIQSGLIDSTLYNTSFGFSALNPSSTGSYNTAIGFQGLVANTIGEGNTTIGYAAGKTNTTGINNSLFGNAADVANNNLSNATAIGANAQVAQSNSLILGSISGVNGATACTNVGIGTTTPIAALDDSGTFKMGVKGTINKNIISFAGTLSGTSIPAGVTTISTSGITIITTTVVQSVNNPTFAAGSTDLTVTIPTTDQPTTTQATVEVSPSFDLPDGVSIASTRLSAVDTVKIRFVNANTTAATLSDTSVYITIHEF